jgi:hypothetical protein
MHAITRPRWLPSAAIWVRVDGDAATPSLVVEFRRVGLEDDAADLELVSEQSFSVALECLDRLLDELFHGPTRSANRKGDGDER